jgi:hypothetical protein
MSHEALRFQDPVATRTTGVAPSTPGEIVEKDEDWRDDPCRCCKSLVMLWWRYCPFCGTQLPTVLDGKVVNEPSCSPMISLGPAGGYHAAGSQARRGVTARRSAKLQAVVVEPSSPSIRFYDVLSDDGPKLGVAAKGRP